MLSLQRSHPRIRDFRGPQPGSVGLLMRPTADKPPDWRILERRADEENKKKVTDQLAYQKKCDLQSNFEHTTNKKIMMNTVKNRMLNEKRRHEINLEDRRDRLRTMLMEEENRHIEEMTCGQETTIERQARLREKARMLREEKETARQELAQEKYRQLWRQQCEELRTQVSKRQTLEIAADRVEQIRQKQDLEAHKKETEDAFFSQLWSEELQKKVDREEKDLRDKMARNMETADAIKQQIAALKCKKEEEKNLKFEECKLLEEMARLRQIEDEKELAERMRKQQETRDLLQASIRLKMRRKAKEIEQQMAFDQMIMEQILEESKQEAEMDLKNKEQRRLQNLHYMNYMRQLREEHLAQEREMERLADIEVEKQWQSRVAKWNAERRARGALLSQVLAERKQQVQEKILENERLRQLSLEEQVQLAEQIAANQRQMADEKAAAASKLKNHQRDILDQIEFNKGLRQAEADEDQREIDKMHQAEAEYQARMRSVMSPDWIDPKAHPLRRACIENQYRAAGRQPYP